MKKLFFIFLATLCLAIGLTGCSNASGGGSNENYRAEMGYISDATYNTAYNTISSYTGSEDYATTYALRTYLRNNTISNYQSENGGTEDDVRELLINIGLSNLEISAAIQTLEIRGNIVFLLTTVSNEKGWLYITQ